MPDQPLHRQQPSRTERAAGTVLAWILLAGAALLFLYFFRAGLEWIFS